MDAQSVQQQIITLLASLSDGEEITIPGRCGWEIVLGKATDGIDLSHQNPSGDGRFKFFTYTTKGNKYGAGITKQEPSLGILLNSFGVTDGVKPTDTLVGAIVLDEHNKVSARYSWSNVVFMKKQNITITSAGELKVGDVSQGFVTAVFLPDKNRMEGYVGVFRPSCSDTVKVLEMESVVLAAANTI